MAKPVLETHPSKARVIAGGETLIVHRNPEVTGASVREDRPRVMVCPQRFPDKLVETDRCGTRQLDRAMQWFPDGDLSHDGGDVLGADGLHQDWREPDRLPLGGELGEVLDELKELRGANNRMGNLGGFDQVLLGHLRTEVATR